MLNSRVTFNENVKIKYLYVWPFAHWAARKNNWQFEYSDRLRFQNKIQTIGLILHPILQKKHRAKVLHKLLQDSLSLP